MFDAAGLVMSPGEFVAILNQSLEYAFPNVIIEGELSSFRISKNKWLYFDLKDKVASVKCFGTIYQLPGPLEDGLRVQVRAVPRLHPQFGFSLTVQSIQPVGEGTLKRAFELLQAKLQAEGLFDEQRKRPLPYPPSRIGLVASRESAAYADFVKIINERWGGLEILVADVQVQGEVAPAQIVAAIEYFNTQMVPPDVIVITRGGGSADDLYAFNTEQVTRAVAASRVCTLVAIGHEIDISLAELAADQRASTPSNAAQLLVPERADRLRQFASLKLEINRLLDGVVEQAATTARQAREVVDECLEAKIKSAHLSVDQRRQVFVAYDPYAVIRRGYALIRHKGAVVTRVAQLKPGQKVSMEFSDGKATAEIMHEVQ